MSLFVNHIISLVYIKVNEKWINKVLFDTYLTLYYGLLAVWVQVTRAIRWLCYAGYLVQSKIT